MVLDKILVKSKDKTYEIDSYDNKTIEEIRINDNIYHFAELNYSQGISKLQMEDAVEEPLYITEIVGNLEQGSYNGYNVFNAKSYKKEGYSGITMESKNNLFIANGLGTADVIYGTTYTFKNVKPNTKYSFRLKLMEKNNSSGKFEARFYVFTETPNFVYIGSPCTIWALNGSEAVGTYTFTEEQIAKGIQCGVYFKYDTTSVFDNVTVRADIVEGTYTKDTFPPYEPYVGGTPSPNLNYPQPIKTVKNMEITVRGLNLLNPALYLQYAYTYNGIALRGQGDEILMTGTATASIYNGILSTPDKTVAFPESMRGKTLYISAYETGLYNNVPVEFGFYNDENSGMFFTTTATQGVRSIDIPSDRTKWWIRFRFTKGKTYDERFKIMISDTPHTEFVSYKEPVTYTIPDDLYGEHFYLGKIDIASTGVPAEYLPYTTEVDSVQVYNDADPYGGIGHVLLTKVTGKYELTGRETITYDGTFEYGYAMCVLKLEGIGSVPGMLGQCAKCTIARNYYDYQGTYHCFDMFGGSGTTSLMLMMPSLSSVEELMAILRERYDAGNPEYVIYPRESVYMTLIEYSAAGQELLKVSNVKGTSILEMKSELEPTLISVDYWKQKRPLR